MTDNDGHFSSRTADALRDAMKRLLAGQPRHADGRLTKSQPRPGGWRQPRDPAPRRARLNGKTRECTDLRRQFNAAATVIATVHHENNALRAQLNRDAIVIAIDRQHHEPPCSTAPVDLARV